MDMFLLQILGFRCLSGSVKKKEKKAESRKSGKKNKNRIEQKSQLVQQPLKNYPSDLVEVLLLKAARG